MAKTKMQRKLAGIRRRATKRDLDFDLNLKWLTEKFDIDICEATGIKLAINGDPTIDPNYPSIDRIDSTKGYTKDNCKIVSRIYNVAKGDQSEEILIEWSKLFVEKYENEVILEKSV